MQEGYLNNQLLIAMPQMHDPVFEKTVTLICEHNADGALGIVINRPIAISVGEVLQQLDLEYQGNEGNEPVLIGGPVASDRGFVLHRIDSDLNSEHGRWASSLDVSEQIRVTTSKDIMLAIANGSGPSQKAFALGYSGWEAGQLEEELLANAWLTAPCDTRILFEIPYAQRWEAAAQSIGIDLHNLSGDVGHA
ncbi:MAG: YqgE/AlgH family protein [Gammaproteobacteria bacterium]|nr:YqgE/AlgH family protein [Gammaproteobacteria bacterium]NNC97895.1 YqgE/AlgH family protein [Gammaproteobacteria bacterium]NNM13536.1 YqgE/AlgH family protein [Gammaproteobacteria bacterium]